MLVQYDFVVVAGIAWLTAEAGSPLAGVYSVCDGPYSPLLSFQKMKSRSTKALENLFS